MRCYGIVVCSRGRSSRKTDSLGRYGDISEDKTIGKHRRGGGGKGPNKLTNSRNANGTIGVRDDTTIPDGLRKLVVT